MTPRTLTRRAPGTAVAVGAVLLLAACAGGVGTSAGASTDATTTGAAATRAVATVQAAAATATASNGTATGEAEASDGTVAPPTTAPPTDGAEQAVGGPPVNARVDYQLGGSYTPEAGVRVVTRDRTARPVSGRYSICYVNAFQTQPGERSLWPAKVLLKRSGTLVTDPDWPDEVLLDTSTAGRRSAILTVLTGWLRTCAARGFQAVEADNLDSWTRSHSLLTRDDNLALARSLVTAAHRLGLAVGQKNAAEVSRLAKSTAGFDFAVAEECQVYAECGAYTAVYGRHVIEIEYTDAGGVAGWQKACRARGDRLSIVLRDRDVVPRGHAGYVYRAC